VEADNTYTEVIGATPVAGLFGFISPIFTPLELLLYPYSAGRTKYVKVIKQQIIDTTKHTLETGHGRGADISTTFTLPVHICEFFNLTLL